MPPNTNFYDNVNEASMRLRKTVVMYEGEPYYVMFISDHKNDGILRIYMAKMGREGNPFYSAPGYINWESCHYTDAAIATDEWLKTNPNGPIIRRYLGASGFNKFRPFPLGNMNVDGQVAYIERTPKRNTHQGLRSEAMLGHIVSIAPNRAEKNLSRIKSTYVGYTNFTPDIFSAEFYDCVMGCYPSYYDSVNALLNPEVLNTGIAFHRDFSVLRGPLNLLILCYRNEGIGLIEDKGCRLVLSKDFKYLKETIEETGLIPFVTIQE